MAVQEHPDMPKSIGGLQGLNPWNVLFLNVVLAWWRQRHKGGPAFPKKVGRLLWIFGGIILVAFARLVADPANLEDYSFPSAASEYLINNLKWMLLCVLFFIGCNTRKRILAALVTVLCTYFLLAVQVVRWIPLEAATKSGEELAKIAAKLLQNEVGYNRVTLSMMLGGASWGVLAALPLCRTVSARFAVLGAALTIMVGQALTGGRTGYVSWAFVGLVFCLTRWRRFLPLIPIGAGILILALPGLQDRILFGIGGKEGHLVTETDTSEMTSGRTTIWPEVIKKIGDAPLMGYGRLGMIRNGLADWLMEEYQENFNHPHNAYLEQMMDSGIIGLVLVIPLYLILLKHSFSVFFERRDPLFSAVGGAAAALLLALLVGALAGQTFYPREGSVGMWAVIGVMLRVQLEKWRVDVAQQRVTPRAVVGEMVSQRTESVFLKS
jgi:O-antigen ligase